MLTCFHPARWVCPDVIEEVERILARWRICHANMSRTLGKQRRCNESEDEDPARIRHGSLIDRYKRDGCMQYQTSTYNSSANSNRFE